jgi:hypothetical protein
MRAAAEIYDNGIYRGRFECKRQQIVNDELTKETEMKAGRAAVVLKIAGFPQW